MKQIKLTQNQFALVDNEDFEELNQHKWCASWQPNTKSFYAMRKSKRKDGKAHLISMAREVLGLKRGDKRQADHIDHNTLNNRRSNLRIVTNAQNQFNQKSPKGYHWDKSAKKYHAQIMRNRKNIYLGCFSKAENAHNAYLQAKKQYHKIGIIR